MSNQVMNWVFKHSEARGNDRLVLIALADEADDDGTNAYPSIDRLASKTRIPKRTVMRCLVRLEELEELEVHRPETRGRGKFNTYVVVMDGGSKIDGKVSPIPERRADPEKRRGKARKGAPPCLIGDRPIDPLTLGANAPAPTAPRDVEPLTLIAPEPTPVPPRAAPPVEVVFAAWQESTGKPQAKLDAKRRRVIQAALATYPVEDVLDAVRGWRHSPHHRGENDRGTVYNDLGLLLRDASRIEQFRDLERDGPTRPRRTDVGPRRVPDPDQDARRRAGPSGRVDPYSGQMLNPDGSKRFNDDGTPMMSVGAT